MLEYILYIVVSPCVRGFSVYLHLYMYYILWPFGPLVIQASITLTAGCLREVPDAEVEAAERGAAEDGRRQRHVEGPGAVDEDEALHALGGEEAPLLFKQICISHHHHGTSSCTSSSAMTGGVSSSGGTSTSSSLAAKARPPHNQD